MGTDNIMLNFEVNASLIKQLGEELITDDIAAIAEIVKNSYDADASVVNIEIEPDAVSDHSDGEGYIGKIVIKDNGAGMDLDAVKKGWLTISHSEKKNMKQNGLVTRKYKRLPLGDKGLGRLSTQRLGTKLRLRTKKEGSLQEYVVDIDWSLFKQNVNLSQITIPVSFRIVTPEKKNKHYTCLTITDLADRESWTNTIKIDAFEDRLAKIRSPFDFNKSFFIKAKINDRKLELQQVPSELLMLAPASYTFVVDEQQICIDGSYRLEYFPNCSLYGDRLEEFVESLDKDVLKRMKLEHCDEGPILFNYHEETNMRSIGNIIAEFHPGCFEGKIYDYSLDKNVFGSMVQAGVLKDFQKVSELRSFVKQYSGIKIFRDQFRILPYDDADWLNLGRSYSGASSYYFLRPANVVGYVKLTGQRNHNLKETTSREGFIDDGYSRTFNEICIYIVQMINNNRGKLRREYNEFEKSVKESIEANKKYIPSYIEAKEKIKKVDDVVKVLEDQAQAGQKTMIKIKSAVGASRKTAQLLNAPKAQKDEFEILIAGLAEYITELDILWKKMVGNIEEVKGVRESAIALASEIEATMFQVQEVIELAGLGLTAETASHELFSLITNTVNDTEAARKYFRNKYTDKDIKMEAYIDSINTRARALRKQVAHIAPGLKNVRSKREDISIKELIAQHLMYYEGRAKRQNIKLSSINPEVDVKVNANKGMLVQVFDNLYTNSEYWLLHAFKNKYIKDMNYNLKAFKTGIIHVWDNGVGIDKNYEDRIFEPFITTKPDGRGLGLYIVTRILNYYDCSIRLLEPRNEFGNRYKFAIDLSRIIIGE